VHLPKLPLPAPRAFREAPADSPFTSIASQPPFTVRAAAGPPRLPSSGRVRVTVSPTKVLVEYVRSYLPADATVQHPDGEIAFSYQVST
jgi:hypothetical protein